MRTSAGSRSVSAASRQYDNAQGLSRLIAIDVRNLAVLRIGLAIVILVDLAQRVGSIEAFCSDQGVLNRELNRWLCPPSEGFWSLYWLSGSTGFATGLMAVNALVAVCLLLGWQTRLATAACLVLAYSLQIRNPLVLTAGHILLRMLLFWSLFLPLGAVWSVDAWRKRGSVGKPATAPISEPTALAAGAPTAISIATAAVMIQVGAMYLFSGIAKWNDIWLRGEAMSLAMQLDMYVKPLGRELLNYPGLLMLLTFSILLLETIGPLLLWMPIANAQWRAGLLVLFWLMHIGIWLTMSIGIFSAVAMLAWVVFLPNEFWQAFGRRLREFGLANILSDGAEAPPNSLRLGTISSIVCGVFLVYVIALNVANIDSVQSKTWFGNPLRKFGNATMTLQQFKMFERPAKENLWWRLVYTNPSNGMQDMLPRVPQPLADIAQRPPPAEIYNSMPNQFWRRLLFNLATIESKSLEDANRLKALRQRAGIALWELRNTDRALDANQLYEWYCCRQQIGSEEWDPPVELERWASIAALPGR